jgi:hypothetical protein
VNIRFLNDRDAANKPVRAWFANIAAALIEN